MPWVWREQKAHSYTNTVTWEMNRWFVLLYKSNFCMAFSSKKKKKKVIVHSWG